jgi:hypothetical protein
LRAAVGGIEAAVKPRLHEGIDIRPELRVEEQGEPWIEKIVVALSR